MEYRTVNAVLEPCQLEVPDTVLQFEDFRDVHDCTIITYRVDCVDALPFFGYVYFVRGGLPCRPYCGPSESSTLPQRVLSQSGGARDDACSSPHCNHPGSSSNGADVWVLGWVSLA